MKSFLVGYTGFVGSNLNEQYKFTKVFNSKNIEEAYNQNPDLLVYCGVPAQKFIANNNPNEDFKIIENAIENIKKISPKKIILISTIDIYDKPIDVNEDFFIVESKEAYGKNRKFLEDWIQNNFKNYLIVRLPGLYGKNLKKNFIYDLMHTIPSNLKEEKYNELSYKYSEIKKYYINQNNGFYKCKDLTISEEEDLNKLFKKIGFSTLNFTDSRGSFQFYNLKYLWEHITIALNNKIKIINLATEPITINELYKFLYNKTFKNEITDNIPEYNFKTKYDNLYNGKNGYLFDKSFVLNDIKSFINNNQTKINICISNIAWSKNDNIEIYKYLKDNNINYMEIAPTKIIETEPYSHIKDAKKIIDNLKNEFNLKIGSMQSIWYGKKQNIFESNKNKLELIEYTKKAIDFASEINCPNIVFGNPKNRNMNNLKKDYPIALSFFKELNEYATKKNVIIAIEPNPKIYNTNFLTNTYEAINFVKELNLSNIKINYDLGTVIENKESLDILKDNISYINHIHISEPNLELIKKRKIHTELLKILIESKYSGLISIEMKETNTENIKKIINYLKNICYNKQM